MVPTRVPPYDFYTDSWKAASAGLILALHYGQSCIDGKRGERWPVIVR